MSQVSKGRSRRVVASVIGLSAVAAVGMTATAFATPLGVAPGVTPPVPAVDVISPPVAYRDIDGDRVSDEFESDLLAAAPGTLFDVIIRTDTGDPLDAQQTVGPFAVGVKLGSIRGFAATMTATQALALAGAPTTFRVDRDAPVRLADDGGRADHGVDHAEIDFGVTGAGVGICVIDSGVDISHEQLDNGKVVGWLDLINNLPVAYDDHNNAVGGHGTHVASIAAGDGVGGPLARQYRGVAPGASLYVVKAFPGTVPDDIPLVSPTAGQESVTIEAIEWCVDQPGVDILSMSFTKVGPTDGTDPLGAAVEAAVAAGKIAIAAAGNDGPNPGLLGSPGAAASAITVGAVADWSLPISAPNRSEGPFLAAFSSRGPTADGRIKPDLTAPGHTVSAASSGTAALYIDKSGTSMATPFVAGAAALALQRNPSLSPADLGALFEATAIDRGAGGKDSDWGAGMIDVYGVLATANGPAAYEPTAFPTHLVIGGTTVGGAWTHEFDIGPDGLSVPIAATVLINGGPDVSQAFWDPDLQVTLTDPNGLQLDFSNCPLLLDPNDCLGNTAKAGRQELVHSLPTVTGRYVLTVSDAAAQSGSFLVDLSHGPVAVGATSGPCTIGWVGSGDGVSWADGSNWTSGASPLPTDVVCIPLGATVSLGDPLVLVRGIQVDGTLVIGSGARLILTDTDVSSAVSGVLVLDAGATVTAVAEVDLAGDLLGNGVLDGPLHNHGRVLPGGAGVGKLTITGDYRQSPAGSLAFDIAAALPGTHDMLGLGGDATLGGSLALDSSGVFEVGDDVEIIDVDGTRSGEFAAVEGLKGPHGIRWALDVSTDAPDVHVVVAKAPGPDANGSSDKVTICHRPGTKSAKTMHLPANAALSHMRSHGDTAGAC